jgi:DNA repair protein RadA/Sms
MSKPTYQCTACGAQLKQWQGQCLHCSAWGTVQERSKPHAKNSTTPFNTTVRPSLLEDLTQEATRCLSTGSPAVDELLGQGLPPGSVVLLSGEPGMGKSTFLLQLAASFNQNTHKALYVSSEESLGQLKQRSERLGLLGRGLPVLNTTSLEEVLSLLEADPPTALVLDSVQTVSSTLADGIPGSMAQVRAAVSALVEAGKKNGTIIFLVGHVTKEGQIAGPKVMEHMVDTVLYLEGDSRHLFRIIRVVKNRFGPTSNVLVLKMMDSGLQIVHDPSTFFLQARDPSLSGTALIMARDGQRSFVIELQSLATKSFLAIPRRTALGLESNRLNLLLAIADKKLRLNLGQMDIYAKTGGGLKISEPGLDLGLIAAVLSSYYDRCLPEKAIFWGEVDLNGQVRPVVGHEQRLKQARALKYAPIVCPDSQETGRGPESAKDLLPVGNILDLPGRLFNR